MASGFRDVAVGGVVSHRALFPQVKGHAIIGGCDVVHRTGIRRDEIVGSIVGQEEVLPAALLGALNLAGLRCRDPPRPHRPSSPRRPRSIRRRAWTGRWQWVIGPLRERRRPGSTSRARRRVGRACRRAGPTASRSRAWSWWRTRATLGRWLASR